MPELNRYKLAHVTVFAYDGPVSESYNELRLRPRHDETQSCLSFRILTHPVSKPAAHSGLLRQLGPPLPYPA